MCDFIFFSALPFMPVGCTLTSITQVTQRDWPRMRREAQKYVVSVMNPMELCFFYLKLKAIILKEMCTFILRPASIPLLWYAWLIDSYIQLIYIHLLKNESIFAFPYFSWVPMCPLGPVWPLGQGSECESPSSSMVQLYRWDQTRTADQLSSLCICLVFCCMWH